MLDSAVHTFGTALSNELNSVEGKNTGEMERKRSLILSKWLGVERKFRDPGAAVKKSGSSEEMSFETRGPVT